MLCMSSSFLLACLYPRTDWCLPRYWLWLGFIPILYTTLSTRWRTSPVRLPDESSDDTLDGLSESQKFPPEKLTGRRVLLLWLPALCDLTGTTVRAFTLSSPTTHPELIIYVFVRLGSTAHERWLVVYPRVNLSNDPWCTSTFRWDPFRVVPPSQAVPLSVSYVFLYAALFINACSRWLSLLTVMAGVSLVGFSGSLIKDTLHEVAPSLMNFIDPPPATGPPVNEPIDESEATKVVIGIYSSVCLIVPC